MYYYSYVLVQHNLVSWQESERVNSRYSSNTFQSLGGHAFVVVVYIYGTYVGRYLCTSTFACLCMYGCGTTLHVDIGIIIWFGERTLYSVYLYFCTPRQACSYCVANSKVDMVKMKKMTSTDLLTGGKWSGKSDAIFIHIWEREGEKRIHKKFKINCTSLRGMQLFFVERHVITLPGSESPLYGISHLFYPFIKNIEIDQIKNELKIIFACFK